MGIWSPGPGPTDGNDVFQGDDSDELAIGGAGDDTLYGEGGRDDLRAGIGSDTIYGGSGDDYITIGNGAGNDSAFAGPGDDRIQFDIGPASGVFNLDGGDGFDVTHVSHPTTIVTLAPSSTIANVEAIYLRGAFAVNQAQLNALTAIWGHGGHILMSTPGSFDLSALSLPESFSFRVSDTQIFSVNNANFYVNGTSGADIITLPTTPGARITVLGEGGNDIINGSNVADTFIPGAGDDTVHAGGGNDRIDLDGGGTDIVNGGVGDDTFVLQPADPSASIVLMGTIDGGDGQDTLLLSRSYIGPGTTFSNIETTILVSTGGSNGLITMAGGTLPTTGVFLMSGARLTHSSPGMTDLSAMTIPTTFFYNGQRTATLLFTGSSGDDGLLLPADTGAVLTANGGTGNDHIRGGMANDTINGGSGIDLLEGGGGDDLLIGGAGATTFRGGDGVDTVSYASLGAISATINLEDQTQNFGFALGDTFESIEIFIGGMLHDNMRGDANANIFRGGDGNDTLEGQGGDDTLEGGAGEDILRGGDGNDRLFGGGGQDQLFGDAGDDVLFGSGIPTLLNGGAGTDTADYTYFFSVDVDLQAGRAVYTGGITDPLVSIENIIGATSDDILRGDASVNRINGSSGNDLIEGRRGADVIDGGAGSNDIVAFSSSTQGVTVDLIAGAS